MNDSTVKRRLDSLDARLSRIERTLRISAGNASDYAEVIDTPPAQLAATVAAPPVAAPEPVTPATPLPQRVESASPPPNSTFAPLVDYLPRPPLARAPGTQLEQTIGLKWAGWVGAIVLVIGAALGIKFAYDQGWLGGIPPAARLVLMSLGGFALIGVGEVVYRRVGRVASAGLFGAGVATLFVVSYAGHAYYALYAREMAFALMALSTVVGAAVAIRGNLVSVAALSLIGGNIAPLVIRGQTPLVAPLLTYLLALQIVALFLAWWGASRKWWWLRILSLVTTTLWTAQLMLGSPVSARGFGAPMFFSILFAGFYQLELILSALRAYRGGHDFAARRMAGFSIVMTALLCTAGLYVWRDAPDLARGGWVIALAGVCAAAGFVLPRIVESLRSLGIGFRIQAAALLVVAVPVALSGPWIAIGWGALGFAFAMLGAALDLTIARRAAAITWCLGVFYLLAWTVSPIYAPDAREIWLRILGHGIPAYAVVAASMTLIGHVIAWLLRNAMPTRELSVTDEMDRASMLIAAFSGIVWLTAAVAALPTLGATLAIVAYAWLLAIADRFLPRANLAMQSAAVLLVATTKWIIIDTLANRLAPGWQPMLYRPVLNPVMGMGLLLAASMAGVAWLRRRELVRAFGERSNARFISAIVATILVILTFGFSFEIDRVVERSVALGSSMTFPASQIKQLAWTMLWSAAACAAMGIWRWLDRGRDDEDPIGPSPSWLVVVPLLLVVKFLLLDTLVFRFDHGLARTATVLFNLQTLAALFVLAPVILARWVARGREHRRAGALLGFAIVLILLWTGSFEVDRAAAWLTRTGTLAARESIVRQVGLSIFWSLYAVGCVGLGFRVQRAALRYFGLGLFAVTLAKVVLIDLSQVATGYRIISFMGLGLLLLGTSVLYGKLSPKLLRSM